MNDYWREPRKPIRMEDVIRALSLTAEVSHGSPGGASADELTEAERTLGRRLPDAAREFYAAYNGGEFIGGNIRFLPLHPSNDIPLSLTTASDLMRSWEWPVPPEMVIFGGNGSEESYGLWLHDQDVTNPLVVAIGENFTPDSLAIVGDNLAGFLAGHCAYYLLMFAMDGIEMGPAMDALGVPSALRAAYRGTKDDYFRLLNWANPNLPDKTPDPHLRALTPEQVNEVARSRP